MKRRKQRMPVAAHKVPRARDVSLLGQIIAGLYLGFAAFRGITTGSFGAFVGVLVLGSVFLAPMLIGLRRDPGLPRAVRRGAAVGIGCGALVAMALVSSVLERIYAVNTAHYPEWLASGVFTFSGGVANQEGPEACQQKQGPAEWMQKDGGTWVVSCGGLYRPMALRYIAKQE